MLYSVIGNEQRFPLLLGTNNALRIFMVLSETKSALVIKISQRYCLLTVWNSDLFSICFFGRLDFFSGDITKISGNMTQVSGDMTSGKMTLGRLDRLPCHCSVNQVICITLDGWSDFMHGRVGPWTPWSDTTPKGLLDWSVSWAPSHDLPLLCFYMS